MTHDGPRYPKIHPSQVVVRRLMARCDRGFTELLNLIPLPICLVLDTLTEAPRVCCICGVRAMGNLIMCAVEIWAVSLIVCDLI